MKFRLIPNSKAPVIRRMTTGWTTCWWEQEITYDLVVTGKHDIVAFVPTNTPARYRITLEWQQPCSTMSRIKDTMQELRHFNARALYSIRFLWSQQWSQGDQETIESDLVSNSVAATQLKR